MAYFKDLTPYEYYKPEANTLNVGWLGAGQRFSKGKTAQAFKDKLFAYCLDEYVIHIARGFHQCEFCTMSVEEWVKPRYGDKAHWLNLGDGEIRVIGESVIYAAPTLIYHYVVEHRYKPPEEFIQAVLTGPDPVSEQHAELLKKFGSPSIYNRHP